MCVDTIIMNIRNYSHIKSFLINRNLNPHIQDQYIKILKQKCNCTGFTPTQLKENEE